MTWRTLLDSGGPLIITDPLVLVRVKGAECRLDALTTLAILFDQLRLDLLNC